MSQLYSHNFAGCNLIPIRVDALSDDKSIRIVDTLLFDPSCWPVTLYEPLYASVEENVSLIAHTILSDAEVQPMGRTVRHFTGRLDLWSNKLQKTIEDQLRPQLWRIVEMSNEDQTLLGKNGETLIPISIRLLFDRINIHENILWDKHGPLSPFDFAEDMVKEMNLPDDAIISIAMTIIEQLHGLHVDTAPEPTSENNDKKKLYRGAWTTHDSKEHASIVSQVVAQHRSI
ncbi:unnamed protein product [Pseudo-nitzschia multistriata]|uniref:Uncharacterized protein n=1 Tax=Pseudo-nitzschia multistriata TaxID=183589 RepID=A0A448ZKK6_9STRA|nr:unnamed protein product [Pseudo-nitzschia multistriata]